MAEENGPVSNELVATSDNHLAGDEGELLDLGGTSPNADFFSDEDIDSELV